MQKTIGMSESTLMLPGKIQTVEAHREEQSMMNMIFLVVVLLLLLSYLTWNGISV